MRRDFHLHEILLFAIVAVILIVSVVLVARILNPNQPTSPTPHRVVANPINWSPSNTPPFRLLPTIIETSTPTNTPSLTHTPSNTPTPTPEPSATSTSLPTNTPSLTHTSLSTATLTPEPTTTATLTSSATATPSTTVTPTPEPSATSTLLPTATLVPNQGLIALSSNGDIYLRYEDGALARQLIYQNTNRHPSFSPDGSQLVFESSRGGNWDIYLIHLDDVTHETRLTTDPADDLEPVWSPDGSQLAFIRNDNLYLYDFETQTEQLIVGNDGLDRAPSWSPDSNSLLFMSQRDADWEIYAVDLSGDSPVQIRITTRPADQKFPTWSPNGRQIAFISDRCGGGRAGCPYQLYLVDVFANWVVSEPRVVSTMSLITTESTITWSPDSTRVAFISNGDIYLATITSDELTRLTDSGGYDSKFDWWSP